METVTSRKTVRLPKCGQLWSAGSLALTLANLPAAYAQQHFEETVVVTATAERAPIGNVGRAVTVIEREQIECLPVDSVADALRSVAGVDVKARGERGIQTDFSVRGAAFGQTLVLVDGVRLNDSQTGHHNGDIPVPLADVERIEVLPGPGSSLHGADALGGTIQILTRRSRPSLSASLTGGSFGSLDGSFSGRAVHRDLAAGLTFAARRSDGFTEDRDHRILEGRAEIELKQRTRASVGIIDKEFGAKGFYGPAPSREWTRQTLAAIDHSFASEGAWRGTAQLYFRTHRDRFVYDRRHPDLADNRHRTQAAGVSAKTHHDRGETGRVSFGIEAGGDWAESSVLGDHGYGRASLFAELQQRLGSVLLHPGLRYDAYGAGFGSSLSPSLAATSRLGSKARWRASAGHAFRVPTFTELYYRDPNHQASADLVPERAWAVDSGIDLIGASPWSAGFSLFARWDRDLIDWVRSTPAERWRTQNIRRATTAGMELAVRGDWGEKGGWAAEYVYLDVQARGLGQLSKYVGDFARHSFVMRTHAARLPVGFSVGQRLEYRRRADGRSAWLADLRLARRFGRWRGFVEGSNLFDAHYQEVAGVDMPGLAMNAGIEFSR